jgi:hypothetical protein
MAEQKSFAEERERWCDHHVRWSSGCLWWRLWWKRCWWEWWWLRLAVG